MNVSYDSIHKYKEHQYVLDFMNDKEKIEIVRKSGIVVSIAVAWIISLASPNKK